MNKKNSLLGGILLVSGTTIGGGMLGLPVLTASSGFLPTTFIYILAWALMTGTGLLLLEVTLWLQSRANMISMANATLGKWGAIFAWGLYLFFMYSLTIAYVSGCGKFLSFITDGYVSETFAPALFVLLFAPFVVYGANLLSQINSVMMIGLVISFSFFLLLGIPHIDLQMLKRGDFSTSLFALPISFAAFGFQGVVPSLAYYFSYDRRRTQLSIVIGTVIPLLVYIVWEAFILGIVPLYGQNSLTAALMNGDNAITPLAKFLHTPKISLMSQLFAFFALTTSFFGVTLGLNDFLADGLNIPKKGFGRLFLGLLVYLPPLAVATIDPSLFLVALETAGGFGGSLLLGLLPIMMFYSGKYYHNYPTELPVKQKTLFLMAILVMAVLLIELVHVVQSTIGF